MVPQFGTDGLRGKANVDITPEVAFALAQAATDFFGSELFLIGRDTRISGSMIESAMIAGFTSAGANVELLGVVPTPAVAWASADKGRPGVMISASHNPYWDNGIKLFAPGGSKLGDDIQHQIQDRMERYLDTKKMPRPEDNHVGKVNHSDSVEGWERSLLNSIDHKLFSDLKIVVDCAHGSASEFAPKIFSRLGADVEVIGSDPNGVNINDGFGSTDTQSLRRAVVGRQADLGLAFDGDADRLIAVDNEGNVVDGDRVIAILAKDLKSLNKLKDNTVVVTVMTNLGFHKAMETENISVVITGVGDRYVLEALEKQELSLGGEQSGHIICRDIATTGDGILAGIQLIAAIKRSGQNFKSLAEQVMLQVPQVLINVRVSGNPKDNLEKVISEAELIEAGFSGEGRILVRPSGTEPLIRVMVEHNDEQTARKVAEQLESLIKNQL